MDRFIGGVLYPVVLIAAWCAAPFRAGEKRVRHPERERRPEDPKWMFCSTCMRSTWFNPIYWVVEGCTDWECDECTGVVIE